MANTHDDRPDHEAAFMQQLQARAERARKQRTSLITSGDEPIDSWRSGRMDVAQLPDDQQKILRISIGGGLHLPVNANYCRFRGDREACINLLEQALDALRDKQ